MQKWPIFRVMIHENDEFFLMRHRVLQSEYICSTMVNKGVVLFGRAAFRNSSKKIHW